jgi:hypothetical protein
MEANLIEIANTHNPESLKRFLEESGFIVKSFSGDIFSINYKSSTNRWEKWARECRGAVIQYNEGVWQFIKYPLNRITELETDISSVLKDEISDSYFLSMKVDGMLLTVTRVSMDNARLMPTTGIDRMFYDLAVLLKLDFFVLFSSIKSFELSDPKSLKYIASALIISSGVDVALTKDPLECLETAGRIFLERLSKLPFDLCTTSYYFEAHCYSSTGECRDLWGEKHPELSVVSSESYGLYLLGRSVDNNRVAHHIEFSDEIIASGFQQPWTWKIDSLSKCIEIRNDLDRLAYGEVDQRIFLESHPPLYSPGGCLDYEGFVMISHNDSYKIKTSAYYQSVNIKSDYEKTLALAVCGRFSQANRLAIFFNKLNDHLQELIAIYGKLGLIPDIEENENAVVHLLYHIDPFIVPAYQSLEKKERFDFLVKNSNYFIEQSVLFLAHHYPCLRNRITKGSQRDQIIALISSLPNSSGLTAEKKNFHKLVTKLGQQPSRKTLVPKKIIIHRGQPIVLVSTPQELEREMDVCSLMAQLRRMGYSNTLLVRAEESNVFGFPLYQDPHLIFQVILNSAKEFRGSSVLQWELAQKGVTGSVPKPTLNQFLIEMTNTFFLKYSNLPQESFPLSPIDRAKYIKFPPVPDQSVILMLSQLLIVEKGEIIEPNDAALEKWYAENPFDAMTEYHRLCSSSDWEGLEWKSVFVDPKQALKTMNPPSKDTAFDEILKFMQMVTETGIDEQKLFRSMIKPKIEFKYVICQSGENPIKTLPNEKYVFDSETKVAGIFYLFWSVTDEPRYYARMAML